MSTNKSVTLLRNIKPRSTKWRVQVKLLHSWKHTPPYATEQSLEMIFADETGFKVHASCCRSHMFRTERNIRIGDWSVIENFKVSGVGKGKFRPTNAQYKMTITGDTVYSESDHQDDSPFLSFADYEKIAKRSLDENILIDIIGQPYDISNVHMVQVKGEDRKRVQFRMRDLSGNDLPFCLWSSYAEQIENAVGETDFANTIWLFRFAKINTFRGEIQITNAFGATIFDLNPTVAEAVDLRKRLEHDPLPLALPDKKDEKSIIIPVGFDWNDVGVTMISQLANDSEIENTKIICSVKAIDTDWNWYYFACKRCFHGTTMITGKGNKMDKPTFHCHTCHCNVTNVEPKFKLHMIAEDDSGTCKLMMLETVAKSIVGCRAIDLWDGSYEESEDPEVLPPQILAVEGKSFCFGIATSSDAADIYRVKQVFSGDTMLKNDSQSEPLSLMEGVSSTLSSGEMLTIKENSKPSSDCSTPLSKRKDDDANLPEMNSTSKKICLTPIKLEKTKKD